MTQLTMHGACDCHSHVFGPFNVFPLSLERTFDPPESPVEQLETMWLEAGIERAVLVQGSAHGGDHSALLDAIGRDPDRRRGVALLPSNAEAKDLEALHLGGVRAIRFNWIQHLLAKDGRTEQERLTDAASLLEKVAPLGWHAEVHIDIVDLELASRIHVPVGMKIVIDHMGRVNGASSARVAETRALLRLLQREHFWVKLSGADRVAALCDDIAPATVTMREVAREVPKRCVWGLDWPHVNLARKRTHEELIESLSEAVGDERTLFQILVSNPEVLYGFGS